VIHTVIANHEVLKQSPSRGSPRFARDDEITTILKACPP